MLFKTDYERIKAFGGNVLEAINGHWTVDVNKASNYPYAMVVVKGENKIIRVFKILEWKDSDELEGKKMFVGEPDFNMEKKYVGKLINHNLRKRGLRGGRLYTNEEELLEK